MTFEIFSLEKKSIDVQYLSSKIAEDLKKKNLLKEENGDYSATIAAAVIGAIGSVIGGLTGGLASG